MLSWLDFFYGSCIRELVYFYVFYKMHNSNELLDNSDYLDLINGLPELEWKLKAIQKFLRKVTRGKSPEKIKEMLPLLGFSVIDDDIEYDFWDFSVKFPIEKCCNRFVSPDLSQSFILEELADNLAGRNFVDDEID